MYSRWAEFPIRTSVMVMWHRGETRETPESGVRSTPVCFHFKAELQNRNNLRLDKHFSTFPISLLSILTHITLLFTHWRYVPTGGNELSTIAFYLSLLNYCYLLIFWFLLICYSYLWKLILRTGQNNEAGKCDCSSKNTVIVITTMFSFHFHKLHWGWLTPIWIFKSFSSVLIPQVPW